MKLRIRKKVSTLAQADDSDTHFEEESKILVKEAKTEPSKAIQEKPSQNSNASTTKKDSPSKYFSSFENPIHLNKKKEEKVSLTKKTNIKESTKTVGAKAEKPKAPTLSNLLISNGSIETNIDLMLQMEQLASKNQEDQFMAESDDTDSESESTTVNNSAEENDEFEEVEMEQLHDLSKVGRGKTIQVIVSDKKSKKQVDLKARMERMFKTAQKKIFIMTVKTHLVSWLAHGFYLNKMSLDSESIALVMSQSWFNVSDKFKLKKFSKKILISFIHKMKARFVDTESIEKFCESVQIDKTSLNQSISELKFVNYLHYILVLIIALRSLDIKVRLCVCFDVIQENSDKKQQPTKGTSRNPNSKKSRAEAAEAKKATITAVKRKSSTRGEQEERTKSKRSKQKESNDEPKRKPSKLAKLKIKELNSSDSEQSEQSSASGNKSTKKKRASTDDDYEIDQNLRDNESAEGDKAKGEEVNENSSSLMDFQFVKVKRKQLKNKPLAKNNKILSSDDDERVIQTEDIVEQVNEDQIDLASKAYLNYWLEVYVEAEKFWCCVDPIRGRVDCSGEMEKQRVDKKIFYVCSFDNDNRVKDVTKRYSAEWTSGTRLLRISHLEEKKLWWERTLLNLQPLDADLDIEEEKQLKEMLLSKAKPISVSEYKDHPLYVLPRHLLKFQAIFPKDATPVTHFRQEPVYLRDNQVTLHSRQTWLKYARSVKPFEKPYKLVKGRIKQSEYKAGVRQNPELDLYGFWQTKMFEPGYAANGKVPRNDFGNVELFQSSMLPHGCVHLRNMPNLMRTCRKLNIDCAAAVVGFDAHGGWSHVVTDGWVICENMKDVVISAYIEDEKEANRKTLEKKKERVLSNWKRLIKTVLIREQLNLKYETYNSKNQQPATHYDKKKPAQIQKKLKIQLERKIDDDELSDEKRELVGGKLNSKLKKNEEAESNFILRAAIQNGTASATGNGLLQVAKARALRVKNRITTAPKRTRQKSSNKTQEESDESEDNHNEGNSDPEYDFKKAFRTRRSNAKKPVVESDDEDASLSKGETATTSSSSRFNKETDLKLSESDSSDQEK